MSCFVEHLPIIYTFTFIWFVVILPVISNNDDWIMGIKINVGQFGLFLLNNNLVT